MSQNNDKPGESGTDGGTATDQSGAKPQPGADEQSAAATGEQDADGAQIFDDSAEALDDVLGAIDEAFDPVAEREAQIDDLTKRLALAHADIQNLHRRHEREKQETAKYAITKFARDVAEVADNFDRAISSVPADATVDNPVLKSLLDGVTMTEREFMNLLERHGVVRVAPVDELFDPHRHQAVAEETNAGVPAGTVLKVFQAGYMIEERVLRPAMVVVAKGGMKPAKPVAEAANDDSATEAEAAPGPAATPSEDGNGGAG